MKLTDHHYGKAAIRVMKVMRAGARHSLKELEVSVMLQGDFDASYSKGDNSLVVPTDTMKNTVNILAHQKLGEENEPFALVLARHFLETYTQIETATINIAERTWERLSVEGGAHSHSFSEKSPATPLVEVVATRKKEQVRSGIDHMLILKTTESGFENYVRDKYTTLPPTKDRIFATELRAMWDFAETPASYAQSNSAVLESMLAVFAKTYSVSVQATLYQMGEAALQAVPEISQVHITMPNKHCLVVNLSPFGIENRNELFVPTDEPHGQIEGTVRRD